MSLYFIGYDLPLMVILDIKITVNIMVSHREILRIIKWNVKLLTEEFLDLY